MSVRGRGTRSMWRCGSRWAVRRARR